EPRWRIECRRVPTHWGKADVTACFEVAHDEMAIALGIHDEGRAPAVWRQCQGGDAFDGRTRYGRHFTALGYPHEAHWLGGRGKGDHGIACRAQLERRTSGREHDRLCQIHARAVERDRKSTRLNSSHVKISYAVFCLK